MSCNKTRNTKSKTSRTKRRSTKTMRTKRRSTKTTRTKRRSAKRNTKKKVGGTNPSKLPEDILGKIMQNLSVKDNANLLSTNKETKSISRNKILTATPGFKNFKINKGKQIIKNYYTKQFNKYQIKYVIDYTSLRNILQLMETHETITGRRNQYNLWYYDIDELIQNKTTNKELTDKIIKNLLHNISLYHLLQILPNLEETIAGYTDIENLGEDEEKIMFDMMFIIEHNDKTDDKYINVERKVVRKQQYDNDTETILIKLDDFTDIIINNVNKLEKNIIRHIINKYNDSLKNKDYDEDDEDDDINEKPSNLYWVQDLRNLLPNTKK